MPTLITKPTLTSLPVFDAVYLAKQKQFLEHIYSPLHYSKLFVTYSFALGYHKKAAGLAIGIVGDAGVRANAQ